MACTPGAQRRIDITFWFRRFMGMYDGPTSFTDYNRVFENATKEEREAAAK